MCLDVGGVFKPTAPVKGRFRFVRASSGGGPRKVCGGGRSLGTPAAADDEEADGSGFKRVSSGAATKRYGSSVASDSGANASNSTGSAWERYGSLVTPLNSSAFPSLSFLFFDSIFSTLIFLATFLSTTIFPSPCFSCLLCSSSLSPLMLPLAACTTLKLIAAA